MEYLKSDADGKLEATEMPYRASKTNIADSLNIIFHIERPISIAQNPFLMMGRVNSYLSRVIRTYATSGGMFEGGEAHLAWIVARKGFPSFATIGALGSACVKAWEYVSRLVRWEGPHARD